MNILRTRILNNMSKLWSKCFLLKYKTAWDKFSSNLHRLLFIVVAFISILLIFEQFQKSVRNQQIMRNSHLFSKFILFLLDPIEWHIKQISIVTYLLPILRAMTTMAHEKVGTNFFCSEHISAPFCQFWSSSPISRTIVDHSFTSPNWYLGKSFNTEWMCDVFVLFLK